MHLTSIRKSGNHGTRAGRCALCPSGPSVHEQLGQRTGELLSTHTEDGGPPGPTARRVVTHVHGSGEFR